MRLDTDASRSDRRTFLKRSAVLTLGTLGLSAGPVRPLLARVAYG